MNSQNDNSLSVLMCIYNKDNVEHPDTFIYQEGWSVFKFAVTNMADVSAEIMKRNNLTGDDVDWLVPHQANLRIIDATANRMDLTSEKVMINIGELLLVHG